MNLCKAPIALVFLAAVSSNGSAQPSLAASPVDGAAFDLHVLVNPDVRWLHSMLIRIGECRLQIQANSVFVYQGSSKAFSAGQFGSPLVLSSGQCQVSLSLSERRTQSFRIRVLSVVAPSGAASVPIIAEYSSTAAPYASFIQTIGDWIPGKRVGTNQGRTHLDGRQVVAVALPALEDQGDVR